MATELQAQLRTQHGSGPSRRMRNKEILPAVLYGKSIGNKSIQVNAREVTRIVDTKLGKNTLINLKIEGDDTYTALIKDYQGHAVTRNITHVDFWNVKPDQIVEIDIETRLDGKAPGVQKGGIVEHTTHYIRLSCRADSIPEEIVVDISGLELNDNIHLSDIKLPAGVTAKGTYNPTIAACAEERAEEVPVAAAAATPEAGAAAAAPGAPGAAGAAPAAAGAAPAAAGKAAAPAAKPEKK